MLTKEEVARASKVYTEIEKSKLKIITDRLRWIFFSKDYCPRCDKFTKWKSNIVQTELYYELKYTCSCCNLETTIIQDETGC